MPGASKDPCSIPLRSDVDANIRLCRSFQRSQQTPAKPTNVAFGVGTQSLNPAAFADLPSTPNGVPLHLGNAPRWQPDMRGFAQFSEGFSLIKQTPIKITEGANFEIRMDVINLFNRVRIGDPNTDTSDTSSFGQIFGKSGNPRIIQLGLRISFRRGEPSLQTPPAGG